MPVNPNLGRAVLSTVLDERGLTRGFTATQGLAARWAGRMASILGTVVVSAVTIQSFARLGGALEAVANEAQQAEIDLRLFQRQLQRNNQDVDDGVAQLDELARKLGVLPTELQGNATLLLRQGLGIEQVVSVFEAAAASGLAAGTSAGQGINNVTNALVTQMSVYLNYAGIAENLSTGYRDYARQIGTTTANLTKLQKAEAAVQLILKATKEEVADLDFLLGGLVGATNRAEAASKALRIELGEQWKPVQTSIVNLRAEVLTGVHEIARGMADEWAPALDGIKARIDAVRDTWQRTMEALRTEGADLSGVANEIAELAGGVIRFGGIVVGVLSGMVNLTTLAIAGWVGIGTAISSVTDGLAEFAQSNFGDALAKFADGNVIGGIVSLRDSAVGGYIDTSALQEAFNPNSVLDKIEENTRGLYERAAAAQTVGDSAALAVADPEAWLNDLLASVQTAMQSVVSRDNGDDRDAPEPTPEEEAPPADAGAGGRARTLSERILADEQRLADALALGRIPIEAYRSQTEGHRRRLEAVLNDEASTVSERAEVQSAILALDRARADAMEGTVWGRMAELQADTPGRAAAGVYGAYGDGLVPGSDITAAQQDAERVRMETMRGLWNDEGFWQAMGVTPESGALPVAIRNLGELGTAWGDVVDQSPDALAAAAQAIREDTANAAGVSFRQQGGPPSTPGGLPAAILNEIETAALGRLIAERLASEFVAALEPAGVDAERAGSRFTGALRESLTAMDAARNANSAMSTAILDRARDEQAAQESLARIQGSLAASQIDTASSTWAADAAVMRFGQNLEDTTRAAREAAAAETARRLAFEEWAKSASLTALMGGRGPLEFIMDSGIGGDDDVNAGADDAGVQIENAGWQFATTVTTAGLTLADTLIDAIQAGDTGGIIEGAAGAGGSVLAALGAFGGSLGIGSAALGPLGLIGAVLPLVGGLIGGLFGGGRDEQRMREQQQRLASQQRSVPAININFTVNNELEFTSSITDPAVEQAITRISQTWMDQFMQQTRFVERLTAVEDRQ